MDLAVTPALGDANHIAAVRIVLCNQVDEVDRLGRVCRPLVGTKTRLELDEALRPRIRRLPADQQVDLRSIQLKLKQAQSATPKAPPKDLVNPRFQKFDGAKLGKKKVKSFTKGLQAQKARRRLNSGPDCLGATSTRQHLTLEEKL